MCINYSRKKMFKKVSINRIKWEEKIFLIFISTSIFFIFKEGACQKRMTFILNEIRKCSSNHNLFISFLVENKHFLLFESITDVDVFKTLSACVNFNIWQFFLKKNTSSLCRHMLTCFTPWNAVIFNSENLFDRNSIFVHFRTFRYCSHLFLLILILFRCQQELTINSHADNIMLFFVRIHSICRVYTIHTLFWLVSGLE